MKGTIQCFMNNELFANKPWVHGMRNSVGFDWHPNTKELWFTDNGRDNIDGFGTNVTDNTPGISIHLYLIYLCVFVYVCLCVNFVLFCFVAFCLFVFCVIKK